MTGGFPDNLSFPITEDMVHCIQECTSCHAVCLNATKHILDRGGDLAEPGLMRVVQDCAEICQVSADFMLRGSGLHGLICETCAVVCEACAQHCEGHPDEVLRACAESCRSCSRSCHDMVTMAPDWRAFSAAH